MIKLNVKHQKDVENLAVSSLNQYQGKWTNQEAAHLLRRTLFGSTLEQINNTVSKGLN